MEQLIEKINEYLIRQGYPELNRNEIEDGSEGYVYPFNRITDMLFSMLSNGIIDFDEYQEMCDQYRERNKYLPLFDMTSRTFGETYIENAICGLDQSFVKENKRRNRNFDGEYDLILDEHIKIEVKACRSAAEGSGSLSSRAYSHQQAIDNNFQYHFQQIKPSCCDVFILVGVCKDEILYWVVPTNDIIKLDISNQHRNGEGENNTDVPYEGQIFANENQLNDYKVDSNQLANRCREKAQC